MTREIDSTLTQKEVEHDTFGVDSGASSSRYEVDEARQYRRDDFKEVNSVFESAAESRPSGPAFERHYSVNEIAEMWKLAYNTIKAMFKNEPGVFSIGSEETRYGRPRITLRIPESVLLRVHKKRTRVM